MASSSHLAIDDTLLLKRSSYLTSGDAAESSGSSLFEAVDARASSLLPVKADPDSAPPPSQTQQSDSDFPGWNELLDEVEKDVANNETVQGNDGHLDDDDDDDDDDDEDNDNYDEDGEEFGNNEWYICVTAEGDEYFYNSQTDETSWELPPNCSKALLSYWDAEAANANAGPSAGNVAEQTVVDELPNGSRTVVSGGAQSDGAVAAADVAAKKRRKQRKQLMKEVVQTEETFCANLDLLLNVFQPGLAKLVDSGAGESCAIQKDELEVLFPPALQRVASLSRSVRDQLQAQVDNATSADAINFGRVFLDLASEFVATYGVYVRQMHSAIDCYSTLKDRPSFADAILGLRDRTGQKLTLEMLLIMPVQRVPRYELLLRDLSAASPVGQSSDAEDLVAAHQAIAAVNERINRDKEAADRRLRATTALATVSRLPGVLLQQRVAVDSVAGPGPSSSPSPSADNGDRKLWRDGSLQCLFWLNAGGANAVHLAGSKCTELKLGSSGPRVADNADPAQPESTELTPGGGRQPHSSAGRGVVSGGDKHEYYVVMLSDCILRCRRPKSKGSSLLNTLGHRLRQRRGTEDDDASLLLGSSGGTLRRGVVGPAMAGGGVATSSNAGSRVAGHGGGGASPGVPRKRVPASADAPVVADADACVGPPVAQLALDDPVAAADHEDEREWTYAGHIVLHSGLTVVEFDDGVTFGVAQSGTAVAGGGPFQPVLAVFSVPEPWQYGLWTAALAQAIGNAPMPAPDPVLNLTSSGKPFLSMLVYRPSLSQAPPDSSPKSPRAAAAGPQAGESAPFSDSVRLQAAEQPHFPSHVLRCPTAVQARRWLRALELSVQCETDAAAVDVAFDEVRQAAQTAAAVHAPDQQFDQLLDSQSHVSGRPKGSLVVCGWVCVRVSLKFAMLDVYGQRLYLLAVQIPEGVRFANAMPPEQVFRVATKLVDGSRNLAPSDRDVQLARAKQMLDRVVKQDPTNTSALFTAACVEAVTGSAQAALGKLERCFCFGCRQFSRVQSDPDLASVRALPQFADSLKRWQQLAGVAPATGSGNSTADGGAASGKDSSSSAPSSPATLHRSSASGRRQSKDPVASAPDATRAQLRNRKVRLEAEISVTRQKVAAPGLTKADRNRLLQDQRQAESQLEEVSLRLAELEMGNSAQSNDSSAMPLLSPRSSTVSPGPGGEQQQRTQRLSEEQGVGLFDKMRSALSVLAFAAEAATRLSASARVFLMALEECMRASLTVQRVCRGLLASTESAGADAKGQRILVGTANALRAAVLLALKAVKDRRTAMTAAATGSESGHASDQSLAAATVVVEQARLNLSQALRALLAAAADLVDGVADSRTAQALGNLVSLDPGARCGHLVKKSRNRWFLLDASSARLYWYKEAPAGVAQSRLLLDLVCRASALNFVDLSSYAAARAPASDSKTLRLVPRAGGGPSATAVKPYTLKAASPAEAGEWRADLASVIEGDRSQQHPVTLRKRRSSRSFGATRDAASNSDWSQHQQHQQQPGSVSPDSSSKGSGISGSSAGGSKIKRMCQRCGLHKARVRVKLANFSEPQVWCRNCLEESAQHKASIREESTGDIDPIKHPLPAIRSDARASTASDNGGAPLPGTPPVRASVDSSHGGDDPLPLLPRNSSSAQSDGTGEVSVSILNMAAPPPPSTAPPGRPPDIPRPAPSRLGPGPNIAVRGRGRGVVRGRGRGGGRGVVRGRGRGLAPAGRQPVAGGPMRGGGLPLGKQPQSSGSRGRRPLPTPKLPTK